jgi:hypothetical protein
MDFHQTSAERFAEKIYNYIVEKFDGKVINSDECNVELMIKNIPFDINDDDINDDDIKDGIIDAADLETPNNDNNDSEEENTPVEEETVTVTDNNEDELFTDNIIEDLIPDKKGKKKKKNKKKEKPPEDNPVKKPRKPNKCIYFRTHPENKQLIDEKAEENDPENPNKKLGKVKAGCTLWNALSTPEKEEWGKRCMADNTD